jgi:hypothetical protein
VSSSHHQPLCCLRSWAEGVFSSSKCPLLAMVSPAPSVTRVFERRGFSHHSHALCVRGLLVSLSSLNLRLIASALSHASVDLLVNFWQLLLSVKSSALVLHSHGLDVAFARLLLFSATALLHCLSSYWPK